MNPQSSRRRGFTLIELLVVIAIIAVLAAILFPVFAKARERAKQTTCLSNTKQIALGIQQYLQDYEDTFPRALSIGDATLTPSSPTGLPNVLNAEVKNADVFHCPSDAGNKALYINYPDVFWKGRGQSYLYNSANPGDMNPDWAGHPGWRGGRTVAQFKAPADTGLLADFQPWHHINKADYTQDGANTLFIDGHAKLLIGLAQNDAMQHAP